jgi:polysaccharide biosynthesis protein PslH
LKSRIKNCLTQHVYDWVIIDHVFLANYIPIIQQFNKGKLAIRLHNIEYTIWEQYASNTTSFFKKKYLQIQTARLKKEELNALKQADLLLPLNAIEGEKLKSTHPNQFYLPITIPAKKIVSNYKTNSYFHLGSMDWLPNVEAITWLLNDIWPKVYLKHPEYKLMLGGKNFSSQLLKLKGQNNIQIQEDVSSSEQFMAQNGVLVVPLLSGSGVRVKILEALAMGIPVISTAKGAEGINVTDKQNIFIADTVAEFVTAIITIQDKLVITGVAGQTLFDEQYDNNRIYINFLKFLSTK